MNRIILTTLSAALLLLPLTSQAGNLDGPGTAGSNMPTTNQIYDLLNAGSAITVPNPAIFNEPAAGPTTGAMKSLSDIQGKLPAPDITNGATLGDVLSTKTFWGLRTDGTWGLNTGTMPNNGATTITPGTSAKTIAAGYHNGSGSVAGSAGLVSGNIKNGVTIFGVAGSSTVVDTSTGTATDANILTGKTAFVNGAMLTGTLSFDGTRGTVSTVPVPSGISKNLDGNNSDQNPSTNPDTEIAEIRQILGGVTTNTLGQIIGVPSNYFYSDSTGTVYSADVAYPASLSALLGTPTIDPFTGLPLTGSNTYSPGWFESPGGTYRFTTNAPLALRARSVMSELLKYRSAPTLSGGGYPCTTGLLSPLGRWCDNNNGTVRDMSTGLIWLKDASWGGQYPLWATPSTTTNAFDRAGQLKNGNPAALTDGSVEGDWGLPTLTQLNSLTIGTEAIRSSAMYKFTGVQANWYWSSSTSADYADYAWDVYMSDGFVGGSAKTIINIYVWPVRGGQ